MIKDYYETDTNSTNYFPELNTAQDAKDYIRELYNRDVPTYKNYMHIIDSFKRKPLFMNKKHMKYTKGRYDSVIGTEKNGLKRKFLFEFDEIGYLSIYKQDKKGQSIKNYSFYKEYNFEELFRGIY